MQLAVLIASLATVTRFAAHNVYTQGWTDSMQL